MKFEIDGVVHEMLTQERLTFAEAKAIEKATGHTMGWIGENGDDVGTTQAFLWVSLKRSDPTLLFSDLDDTPLGDFRMLPDEPAAQDGDGEGGGEADPPAVAADGEPGPG